MSYAEFSETEHIIDLVELAIVALNKAEWRTTVNKKRDKLIHKKIHNSLIELNETLEEYKRDNRPEIYCGRDS